MRLFLQASLIIVGLIVIPTHASVVIETLPVGNAGNAADTEIMLDGTTGYGSVGYRYDIGKFEVTNSQYAMFLNAVAATDTFGLYHEGGSFGEYVSGVSRSGSPGSFEYVTKPGFENRPVNLVDWYDSLRFVNWLQNGQPTGDQGPGTTETGTYTLLGETQVSLPLPNHSDFTTPHWVLPTENEWYKAAYYDPDKPGGPGYWDYATRTDVQPLAELPPGTACNSANWIYAAESTSIYSTEVGAYACSLSAYGTLDQTGNVWEWNEALIASDPERRCFRGGSWLCLDFAIKSSQRGTWHSGSRDLGFRLARVPEPGTLSLLLLGGILVLRRKR